MIQIAPDKWKHFFVGIPIGAILQMGALYAMPMHFGLSIIITFFLVVAISYGFELFSLITKKGHYEILDAIAGAVGGAVGMSFILLFNVFY